MEVMSPKNAFVVVMDATSPPLLNKDAVLDLHEVDVDVGIPNEELLVLYIPPSKILPDATLSSPTYGMVVAVSYWKYFPYLILCYTISNVFISSCVFLLETMVAVCWVSLL